MPDRFKIRRGPKSGMDLKLYEVGYATDEKRLYIGGSDAHIPIPNKEDIEAIQEKVENTSAIVIAEELPNIPDRNEKTIYFKVTDTLTSLGSNVKVSPNMGLKEVK